MAKHMQVPVRDLELPAEVPSQQKVGVPRSSILRGENEPVHPVADVFAEGVRNLNRNRDVSDCVLRLRYLDLPGVRSFSSDNYGRSPEGFNS